MNNPVLITPVPSNSRISELASRESEYFTNTMDKLYPMRHKMALPGAKPPKSPFQRQSLNNAPTSNTPSPSSRLSQPAAMEQGLSRSGRDPIRRRKPVPMPRTFVERPIDVPLDFEQAAYGEGLGKNQYKQQLQLPNNNQVKRASPTRPKSMIEAPVNRRDNNYRVSHKYTSVYFYFLLFTSAVIICSRGYYNSYRIEPTSPINYHGNHEPS